MALIDVLFCLSIKPFLPAMSLAIWFDVLPVIKPDRINPPTKSILLLSQFFIKGSSRLTPSAPSIIRGVVLTAAHNFAEAGVTIGEKLTAV